LLEWLSQRTQKTTKVGKDVEEKNTHTLLVRMQIAITTIEDSMAVPQKTKNRTAI
jgi:hypothetical protein